MSITNQSQCRACGSKNIKRNGYNRYGSLQYYCKDCKASKVLNPKNTYTQQNREEILNAYFERASMRGIQRIYGVDRGTLARWLKKIAQSL